MDCLDVILHVINTQNLTDMDTIEKSNLSQQLLFRDHDIDKFKSARISLMTTFGPLAAML